MRTLRRDPALAAVAAMALAACRDGASSSVAERRDPRPAVSTSAAPAEALATPTATPTASATASAGSPGGAGQGWPPEPPAVRTDWCTEGVHALDEETCYVLPDAPTEELLVYLHGIVPPSAQSPQKTNFQAVVRRASRRAGSAALMPRGERGLAPKGHEAWWGWPTADGAYRKHAPRMIEAMGRKREALEKLVGRRFSRVYLAGSSSGAYFVAALALRGDFAAQGFGAMSGGAASGAAELEKLDPLPFYVGYGKSDSVGGSARALGDRLRRAGWPVRIAAHPVGHGAKEIYLDEAFAFWREHAR